VKLRAALRTLRAGDLCGRVRALRASSEALRVAATGSALRTGLLRELTTPASVHELCERRGWARPDSLERLLRVYAAYGLLALQGDRWVATAKGRRILHDDVLSAIYEGFATYHTALYRDIEQQLTGAEDRHDIERDGELIARLSRFMDEFVLAELDRVVAQQPPRRLLDVGCGAAAHLRHVLDAAVGATAVGIEIDTGAAAMARTTIAESGLGDRAEIVESDVRTFVAERPGERFDLALLANVIYYVPVTERVELLTALGQLLEPGGRLVVVTTALTDDVFSRHFDLLLRAQGGGIGLPDMDELAGQLRAAGLVPEPPRRIAPGEPLTAVVARRSSPD
jgi:SAM-dependent methyltransferase